MLTAAAADTSLCSTPEMFIVKPSGREDVNIAFVIFIFFILQENRFPVSINKRQTNDRCYC